MWLVEEKKSRDRDNQQCTNVGFLEILCEMFIKNFISNKQNCRLNQTRLQFIIPGWKTVEDNVDFDFEVQKTPLEIKTNAEPGSDKMLRVWFETADGIYAGGVRISFNPTPQYFLPTCMSLSEFVEFPVEIPSTTYKVWRVTVNRTKKDVQIVLHCNGQLVLNVQLSDVCTYTTWRKNWVPSSLIKFHHDDSSQMFRAYTGEGK